MTKYIEDLTNNLIGRCNLVALRKHMANEPGFPGNFAKAIEFQLRMADVGDMNGPKLGGIMENFEPGDFHLESSPLQGIPFSGSGLEYQRAQVARLLSLIISYRLEPELKGQLEINPYPSPPVRIILPGRPDDLSQTPVKRWTGRINLPPPRK